MLYTLNLHSVVCQAYFNKTGRKKTVNKDFLNVEINFPRVFYLL